MLDFVLLGLVVAVKPVFSLSYSVLDRGLVVLVKFLGQLILVLNSVTHRVDVILEAVFGINALLNSLVLVSELLSVVDHLLDLLLSEAALVVGNRDGLRLADALLDTGHGQDTVLVNLEGHLDLGNAAGSGRDARQVELAELVVVLDHGSLTLED